MKEKIFEQSIPYLIGGPTFPKINQGSNAATLRDLKETMEKITSSGLSITLMRQGSLVMYLVRIDREERKSELCKLLGIPTNAEFIQQINDYPRQYIATFTTRDKTVDVCHKLRQAYIGREATNYDTKIVINLNNPEQTKLMKEICDYGEFSQTTIGEIGIGYNESPEI